MFNNLNEKFIDAMFPEQASKDISEQPSQISFNITDSNRSSKNQKKDHSSPSRQFPSGQDLNILKIAEKHLNKFNEWLVESQNKFEGNFDSIDKLLGDLKNDERQALKQQDLSLLKNQFLKKQNDRPREATCKECIEHKITINSLQETIHQNSQLINKYELELDSIKVSQEVQKVKDELVNQVQINLLNTQISQLNGQITLLKNQKKDMERTFLFDKTKNSDLQLLQKSKGLSAAKNSTNSSELMNRNETIVFIDPIESDVDEWIKFFQSQKNRYKTMCKKKEEQKKKELGRNFSEEEKKQLHMKGKIFVIFSSLKAISNELKEIHKHTDRFLNSQSSKSFLKQKFNSSANQTGGLIKEENERLNTRLNKLMKLNEYLLCEKNNLEEINRGLKNQRLRQNTLKNRFEEELKQNKQNSSKLMMKIKQYQDERKLLMRNLQLNESEIQNRMGDVKKYKKVQDSKGNAARAHRSSSHKVQYV